MHLVLTGATGLVGSAVLQTMLTTPSISKISILSRRPVAQAEGYAKARVILHKDFEVYGEDVMEGLKDVKGVMWALGISATQVGKEEYERITLTYPLSFARALSKATSPAPLTFIYVSGEGATTTPSFLTAHWARTKGIAESSLLSLSKDPSYSNLRPFTLRPGGVDPKEHTEIHEFLGPRTWIEMLLLPLVRVMPGVKGLMSPTRELGKLLVQLAMGNGEAMDGTGVSGEGRTLNNAAMRRLAGI
ncbi:hypothetical protein ONS95_002902 [Cadophora gregata]|uniref:uncharacterized protein n=1 Tax=Cadophora gregata TaxID=51156 RepID=UPI0026DB5535|nr:uncharacterized protein ONS95_002902 [Cadophora gregata]KAK0108081.1 hypothetical protein ONS95_002902 [Cadophora gregata]KAK0109332.1 hypothetical protein ONS96_003151 [Cadophora gregata f. sp. sojae]